MSFKKLTPIEGGSGGCACCGFQHEHLPLNSLIAVGFGHAAVTKNGEEIYNEMINEEIWTADNAEKLGRWEGAYR